MSSSGWRQVTVFGVAMAKLLLVALGSMMIGIGVVYFHALAIRFWGEHYRRNYRRYIRGFAITLITIALVLWALHFGWHYL